MKENKVKHNTNPNIVIFLGPPGAGKGTLSSLCVQKYRWVQLSTGNLCRQHIAEQTSLGKEIDCAIKAGKLISDDLIISMVDQWLDEQVADLLNSNSRSIILDGFPRTVAQAQALNNLLTKPDFALCKVFVIRLQVDDNELISRLSSRYICQNNNCQAVYSLHKNSTLKPLQESLCDICSCELTRRADDEELAVKQRLALYQKHEKQLIDFYNNINQSVKTINADQALEQVFTQMLDLLVV